MLSSWHLPVCVHVLEVSLLHPALSFLALSCLPHPSCFLANAAYRFLNGLQVITSPHHLIPSFKASSAGFVASLLAEMLFPEST